MILDYVLAAAGVAVPVMVFASALLRHPKPQAVTSAVPRDFPIPPRLRMVTFHIVSFYKRRNIPITPLSGSVGYQTSVITFSVSPDLSTAEIRRTAHDLEHYLMAHKVDMRSGSLRLAVSGRFVVSYSHSPTSPVLLSRLMRKSPPVPGSFIIGLDMLGNTAYLQIDRAAHPHAMVVGTTGSGKSVALLTIAVNALACGWKVIVFNPKLPPTDKVSYGLWQLRESSSVQYVDILDEMPNVCTELEMSMQQTATETLLIVDEVADIIGHHGERIGRPLGRMAQLGREYGVHVILGTPKTTKAVLVSDMLHANAGTNILGLRVNSPQLAMWVGIPELDKLAGSGHARLKCGSEVTEIQVALPDNVAQYLSPIPPRQLSQVLPFANEWISTIGIGESASINKMRQWAVSHNQGHQWHVFSQQYQKLVELGRIEVASPNKAGRRVR